MDKKLKKHICFDVLDGEILEKYLEEMALQGWMVKKINVASIVFEKTNPKIMKFYVDITKKELIGDNYIPTTEYLNSCKEKNLEHIYGNENFQIFIKNGNEKITKENKLSFFKIFKNEIGQCIALGIFCFTTLDLGRVFIGESFINFISSTMLIILNILMLIFIILNAVAIILKIIKYIEIVCRKNKEFNVERNLKVKSTLNIMINYGVIVIGIVSLISVMDIENTFDSRVISKEELPLVIEDFGGSSQERRECDKSYSSSPFATYYNYGDYTYNEVYEEVYDEESESYYEKYRDKDSFSLNYSVFESGYKNIISEAVDSMIKKYEEYDLKYKLCNNEELALWGAKKMYISETLENRVIVYEDKIIEISGDIDFSKENIEIIKKKMKL